MRVAAVAGTLVFYVLVGLIDSACGAVPPLNADEAAVRWVADPTIGTAFNVTVYYHSSDCSLNCASYEIEWIGINGTSDYQPITTAYSAYFSFNSNHFNVADQPILSTHVSLGEYGVYTYVLSGRQSDGSDFAAVLITEKNASDTTYRPLINGFLVLLAAAIAWPIFLYFYHKQILEKSGVHQPLTSSVADSEPAAAADGKGTVNASGGAGSARKSGGGGSGGAAKKKDRLRSLDTFRGFCLSIMIFVNYNGGGYWWFAHSAWNGLTVADLVFPWFIWMMGVSMAISFDSLFRQRLSTPDMIYKIFRRSAILFGLGLMVSNGGSTYEQLRIPGVLQRFAVSFFVVSLILVFVPKRNGNGRDNGSSGPDGGDDTRHAFSEWTDYVYQWLVILGFVALWVGLTFGLDVPGCGRGYIGPGGLADQGQYQDCTGGAAGYIDRVVLGEAHLYQTPTCSVPYQTGAYDPEGILGCVTSIVITYLGVAVGRVLLYNPSAPDRLKRWIVMGLVWGSIAMALSGGTKDGGVIPINKNLWSLSFILGQAGMGCLALSLCYVIIDVWGIWNGAPFIYPGMNSIAVYVGSEMCQPAFPFSWQPTTPDQNSHAFQLTQNMIAVGLWQLAAYYLYTEDVTIKV